LGDLGLIALDILLNLLPPKIFPRLRPPEQITLMTVPEAAVDKKDGLISRKKHVRLSRQGLWMQSITEPDPMK
jgi:hypothetical protein